MCPIDCGECGITKEVSNCGDGECESLESCATCPEDCGEYPVVDSSCVERESIILCFSIEKSILTPYETTTITTEITNIGEIPSDVTITMSLSPNLANMSAMSQTAYSIRPGDTIKKYFSVASKGERGRFKIKVDINGDTLSDKDLFLEVVAAPTSKGIVAKVIDGDTIELQSGEKVRLLGINAPESGEKCYQEATNRLKGLVEGKEAVLDSDEQDKDQYGRLFRYVYSEGALVNVLLVEEGLANVYIIPPNIKFKLELEQAEALAKEGSGCLWEKSSSCADCIQVYNFHYDASGNDCYNLNGEYVILRNKCDYSCDMTGWSVKDEARHIYFFQEFTLGGGDRITLYTGSGTNSQTRLYWDNSGYQCNAVWNNKGDTLYLRDSTGSIVLTYGY